MKRTFKLDLERCLSCGARFYLENFVAVDDPITIMMTLRMLAISTAAPARAPPRGALLDSDCDE